MVENSTGSRTYPYRANRDLSSFNVISFSCKDYVSNELLRVVLNVSENLKSVM